MKCFTEAELARYVNEQIVARCQACPQRQPGNVLTMTMQQQPDGSFILPTVPASAGIDSQCSFRVGG